MVSDTAQHGTTWHSMTQHNLAWRSTTQHCWVGLNMTRQPHSSSIRLCMPPTACRSEQQLPIEFLLSNNISVRSRLVNPESAAPLRGMSFAYVDPVLDVDVSRHVETHGLLEVGISQVNGRAGEYSRQMG